MEEEILGNNSIEDVSWLCSLSDSELFEDYTTKLSRNYFVDADLKDMLISLKMLVLQRAKVIGREELAKRFDLKMLRGLGFILMEHLKEKFKDLSLVPGLVESSDICDCCQLLKCDNVEIMDIKVLKACISLDSVKAQRKRKRDLED